MHQQAMRKHPFFVVGGIGFWLVFVLNISLDFFNNAPTTIFSGSLFSSEWNAKWLAVYILFIALFIVGAMINHIRNRNPDSCFGEMGYSEMESPGSKQYQKSMMINAILYIVAVISSEFLLKLSDSIYIHGLIAFIPITPALLMAKALSSYVKTLDELQLKVIMEASLFSLSITTIGCLTIGFFQLYEVVPNFPVFWIFPSVFVLFGIGQYLAIKKHF